MTVDELCAVLDATGAKYTRARNGLPADWSAR